MRRRVMLLVVAMGMALVMGSGVALAEVVTCDSTPPCYGTPEGDYLLGTSSGETIYAYGGNDFVPTSEGNDTVYGSKGYDDLRGGGGSDKVYGGGGSDTIWAALNDTPNSLDYTYGGGGNDSISAQDGNEDIIDCGNGTADEVWYEEGIDTIKGCEIMHPK